MGRPAGATGGMREQPPPSSTGTVRSARSSPRPGLRSRPAPDRSRVIRSAPRCSAPNDGLVSNLSLVAGVAGASLAAQTILITGFAGLAAGSCAMAIGEWISVQTSREVNERELRVETEELNGFQTKRPTSSRRSTNHGVWRRPVPGSWQKASSRTDPWRSRSWLAKSSASIQTSWADRRGGPQCPRSSCSALARSSRWFRSSSRACALRPGSSRWAS